ncbi:MAG TPA: hypothetical protein VHK89_04855 [Actinomycetota bacterium]|nr:hypothetical protein [Actinomycetota bacterium]
MSRWQPWRRRGAVRSTSVASAGARWSRRPTELECPVCRMPAWVRRPSGRRNIMCLRCGTVFNSKRLYIVSWGDVPPGEGGTAGTREPPPPAGSTGAAALALPAEPEAPAG